MNQLPEAILDEFGQNAEYVAELYAQWRYSPVTVSEEWRQYFESLDGERGDGQVTTEPATVVEARPAAEPEAQAAPQAAPVDWKIELEDIKEALPPTGIVSPAALVDPELAEWEEAEPIRGVASLIVENMEQSLGIPTATSYRFVPVKVLEENRRVINDTLLPRGSKVSFTHLISWAIIEALKKFPQMNAAYALLDGKPHRIQRHDVNLGVAIDIERRDGSRSLIVPNIKGVNHKDFSGFMDAYSDLIGRARSGKLTTEDYQGTTLTLTNPGTIGTIISVPRLMTGQGTIVATGAITYPAEYSAADPDVLTEMGISKVMGVSSTYDHRIIQGAESGQFLAEIHRLMLGEDGFYDKIFESLLIPYPPVRWAQDNKPLLVARSPVLGSAEKEARVIQLIRAYRVRGHLLADLNPLIQEPKEYHPDLDPATYGLTLWDLDREFITGGLAGLNRASLRKILKILRRSYSGHLGIEYMNIQDPAERAWLQQRLEQAEEREEMSDERKREILRSLSHAEAFEQFLHRRYVGSKRFSLEGAEAAIPLMETVLDHAAAHGMAESVMGMAHRGRLNVLHNIMQKSSRAIFSEFEGSIDPESTQGTGDVKYHLGTSGVRHCPGDEEIELTLASNPSHLEAVDPVVEGMAHARQRLRVKGLEGLAMDEVLPVLVHGDSAFAGQGVVAETLNLAQLRGYRTGGTIHIIINNQIGFTTEPQDARSTPFPTDIAKLSQIPIFHVNGDDPEAAVRVAEIALDYRNKFHKDVVIDLVCYRRWGHNEGDDPSYTQPRMYKLIEERNSPREVYAQQLRREGVITQEDAQRMYDEAMDELEEGTKGLEELPEPEVDLEYDADLDLATNEPPETAVEAETLIRISKVLANPPQAFVGHPKLMRQLGRRELSDHDDKLDWATAELLAFGTLLLENFPVRLSGQDSGRGTFSQRHSVLHNYDEEATYIPLNNLGEEQAPFRVWDSMLSEEAVLGFEYGYSLGAPTTLVLWEAQFGDFANGAQVQVDQFISSSRVKWQRESDVTMLLPHGYEGQGPEHSSARLERYLQLSAEDNWRVCVPTTPANYFHLLRRQKHDDVQRPLIVLTPKSLLRLPAAASTMDELTSGRFQLVIDDAAIEDASQVKRVALLSGKLYYDILKARDAGRDDVALVRVEQLYPYPRQQVRAILERYADATDVVWAQEEPRNQGAWSYVRSFLETDVAATLGDPCEGEDGHGGPSLRYIGRPPAASPATGSAKVHQQEQSAIVRAVLAEVG